MSKGYEPSWLMSYEDGPSMSELLAFELAATNLAIHEEKTHVRGTAIAVLSLFNGKLLEEYVKILDDASSEVSGMQEEQQVAQEAPVAKNKGGWLTAQLKRSQQHLQKLGQFLQQGGRMEA